MKIKQNICALLVILAIGNFGVLGQQDEKNRQDKDDRKPKIPIGQKKEEKPEKKPEKKPDKKPDNE